MLEWLIIIIIGLAVIGCVRFLSKQPCKGCAGCKGCCPTNQQDGDHGANALSSDANDDCQAERSTKD
ncbi:MAG: hypothetical protein PVG90_02875 [Bacillota bacterium]|jgi:hypothetical protein